MQQRHASLRESPIAFAHRGARAHAPDNTLESFRLALRLGANGLETDAWLSADGRVVLDHDGVVRRGLRRRPVATVRSADLPEGVPLLDDLFGELGTNFHLSIDVKDPSVVGALSRSVASHGVDPATLWLCSPDTGVLMNCAELVPGVNLVHSTRIARLRDGIERHCDHMRNAGIGTLNLHHTEWNGGNVVLCHRFGLLAFAWDVQFREHIDTVLSMGIDALYSDHVDVMTEAVTAAVGAPQLPR